LEAGALKDSEQRCEQHFARWQVGDRIQLLRRNNQSIYDPRTNRGLLKLGSESLNDLQHAEAHVLVADNDRRSAPLSSPKLR